MKGSKEDEPNGEGKRTAAAAAAETAEEIDLSDGDTPYELWFKNDEDSLKGDARLSSLASGLA